MTIDMVISVILTGMAVTYVIEFLDLFISGFITKPTLNKYFALPLSFIGLWSHLSLETDFIVLVPSATFVSLAIGMYLNRPVVVKTSTRLSQTL
jgi:hypothetical protein